MSIENDVTYHGSVESVGRMKSSSFDPPLARGFPHSARMRIVGALVDAPDGSFTATELSDHAGVSRGTFYEHRQELERLGVLAHEDEQDGPYRLAETPVAEGLRELNERLDEQLRTADDTVAEVVSEFQH